MKQEGRYEKYAKSKGYASHNEMSREEYKIRTHGMKAYLFYKAHLFCHKCKKTTGLLDLHHIDGNPDNDDESNLTVLCRSYHNIIRGWFPPEDEQIKIRWFHQWIQSQT